MSLETRSQNRSPILARGEAIAGVRVLGAKDRRILFLFLISGLGMLFVYGMLWWRTLEQRGVMIDLLGAGKSGGAASWLFWFGLAYLLVQASLVILRLRQIDQAQRPSAVGRDPVYETWLGKQRIAAVSTFVAGEASMQLLEQKLRAMVAMRLPHKNYLLDESNSPEVKALCKRVGVSHFSRKGVAKYNQESGAFASRTRHGNYNAWLDQLGYAAYDLVAVFDLDHVPHADYLEETVPYFFKADVGYVQSPQFYGNQKMHWLARATAEKTFFYYSLGQPARFASGLTILDGCHNVNRVEALAQIGGFQPHKADDLLTTMGYVVAGWRGVYVPKVLATGLAPSGYASFFKQQFQWAYTTLDIKLRTVPKLWSKLNWGQRLTAWLHGMTYFYGLSWMMMLGGLGYILYAGHAIENLSAALWSFVLPVTAWKVTLHVWKQRFLLRPEQERGWHWRSWVASYLLLPYYAWAFFRAGFAALGLSKKVRLFVIPKTAQDRMPHHVWVIHLLIALGLSGLSAWSILTGHADMGFFYAVAVLYAGVHLIPAIQKLLEICWQVEQDRPGIRQETDRDQLECLG